MPLSAGDKLGPYEIVSAIGAGGMGEVYRARDIRLGRDVAIKVLPGQATTGIAWDRFQREARIASSISHPHICAIFDIGESAGQPYLVMELLEGKTLSEFIGKQPVDPTVAAALAVQIADALEAAHAKGVIHRDIKPGNIIVTERRHVKVLDFGLAKNTGIGEADETQTLESLTEPGTVVGTPHYMAPETLQGSKADVRSDVWALGVVLYQMLSGQLPFRGKTTLEVCSAILHDELPPLPSEISPALRRVVEHALEKNREDRCPSAGEMRGALDALSTPTSKSTRRGWIWATGGAAALAVGGVVWTRRQDAGDPSRLLSTGGPASSNKEANELFELAMQFQRRQNDIPRGQAALERALALDPEFPEALRYHAFSYLVEILNGYTNDTSLVYRAEEELVRAAKLDPDLISLPSAFAALYMMQGRRDLVPVDKLDRVIQLKNPTNDSRVWRAILHWMSGENAAAKQQLTALLDREPLFGAGRMFLGEVLRMENDLEAAIREQNKVLELAPGNISAIAWLSLALMHRGSVDETRSLLESKRAQFQDNYLWRSLWALLLAVEKNRADAVAAMDEGNLRFLGAAFVVTLVAAEFYALVEDSEKALEWLDKAVRNGDERIEWFQRDPWLASIRQDTRFKTIVESVQSRRRQRGAR
jgi:serine/threonine protein kinase